MIKHMRAAIFDLDGVIVDTAKYHYLAWKKLAGQLGFDFSEKDNERLKGVSRMRSLEILLEIGGIPAGPAERQVMADQKNTWYVDFIRNMDASEILPQAVNYIQHLKDRNIKVALASASENAGLILSRLRIEPLFDVVVDGTLVKRAKPDPEVFTTAAEKLGIEPDACVVFEDAEAGIEAAHRAGMGCVGIGRPEILKDADIVIPSFQQLLEISLP